MNGMGGGEIRRMVWWEPAGRLSAVEAVVGGLMDIQASADILRAVHGRMWTPEPLRNAVILSAERALNVIGGA